MAVAGHHTGLTDLGSYGELEGSTFMSRMNRARGAGNRNPLALAQAGEAQLNIPQSAFLQGDSIREADDLEQAFRAMVAVHRHDVDAHAVLRFGGCGSTGC